ncbi:hypothetical protein BCR32DRAFT_330551 [Anaeromyces robustus]|uniref:CBM1 domain-containing protein n=1 Tax=Anaeromyces robustus TaxID=1754192 RepID=A0A1Y1VTZ8_9FUNG|nr:hypothetical protein BCR32DRAFT_330551 [Anaeromyces robustus]|eukprot:ORX64663.1 hypothetical protein BCR32DRAFT_330551 [Anaeromyces robustus]
MPCPYKGLIDCRNGTFSAIGTTTTVYDRTSCTYVQYKCVKTGTMSGTISKSIPTPSCYSKNLPIDCSPKENKVLIPYSEVSDEGEVTCTGYSTSCEPKTLPTTAYPTSKIPPTIMPCHFKKVVPCPNGTISVIGTYITDYEGIPCTDIDYSCVTGKTISKTISTTLPTILTTTNTLPTTNTLSTTAYPTSKIPPTIMPCPYKKVVPCTNGTISVIGHYTTDYEGIPCTGIDSSCVKVKTISKTISTTLPTILTTTLPPRPCPPKLTACIHGTHSSVSTYTSEYYGTLCTATHYECVITSKTFPTTSSKTFPTTSSKTSSTTNIISSSMNISSTNISISTISSTASPSAKIISLSSCPIYKMLRPCTKGETTEYLTYTTYYEGRLCTYGYNRCVASSGHSKTLCTDDECITTSKIIPTISKTLPTTSKTLPTTNISISTISSTASPSANITSLPACPMMYKAIPTCKNGETTEFHKATTSFTKQPCTFNFYTCVPSSSTKKLPTIVSCPNEKSISCRYGSSSIYTYYTSTYLGTTCTGRINTCIATTTTSKRVSSSSSSSSSVVVSSKIITPSKTIPLSETLPSKCITSTTSITIKETTTITETMTVTVKITNTNNPSQPNHCADRYAQCGGEGFKGPTCCKSGYKCQKLNKHYSQCV